MVNARLYLRRCIKPRLLWIPFTPLGPTRKYLGNLFSSERVNPYKAGPLLGYGNAVHYLTNKRFHGILTTGKHPHLGARETLRMRAVFRNNRVDNTVIVNHKARFAIRPSANRGKASVCAVNVHVYIVSYREGMGLYILSVYATSCQRWHLNAARSLSTIVTLLAGAGPDIRQALWQ